MGKKKNSKPARLPQSLALPCTGVESHAHLDLAPFSSDIQEVLERAKESGVRHICNVFLGHDAWKKSRHLFDGHDEVFFIMGTHPSHVDQCTDAELDAMRAAFAEDSRLRGVGEIGLDYYWDHFPREAQKEIFIKQLHLAKELDTRVIIHSRDAAEDTIAILEAEGFVDYPVLWHCFGGNTELAERIVKNGWYLSIPGTVTYPKNEEAREALKVIPLDRMLVETDSPYLTPVPYRGKRNEPAYTVFTAECIAKELGMETEEIWTTCGNNAVRFFGL
ncbi:TatD family hydrolase [Halodesulfovibrio sp.]|jgi:TatD DNase family protein|uniref:TatD family hydrolase n=1 Tax=Halodesulfovibrio sp. TaxID=1912772 RepID=UPI0025CF784C|nr:TatD family hydrolase [Halodesulfovibrio sp.]MCT4535319.1 TatD family hydrolase [Halodesulfovibrio sp.]